MPLFALSAPSLRNTLVKGASFDSVYYVANNDKRYVFPNESVFKSWYVDFIGIQTIADQELYGIPLGGNVTYKPGNLIKITTDPKVYSVGQNGTLRWVETEALAIELYGVDWAKQVKDVADVFFINYTLGTPIKVATDFNHLDIESISADKGFQFSQPTISQPTQVGVVPQGQSGMGSSIPNEPIKTTVRDKYSIICSNISSKTIYHTSAVTEHNYSYKMFIGEQKPLPKTQEIPANDLMASICALTDEQRTGVSIQWKELNKKYGEDYDIIRILMVTGVFNYEF